MILVSVSGAQSCGKSSVLEDLKKRNLGDFHVDDFKAARSVLADFGLPLTEITRDAANLIEFQTLVLEAKIQRDRTMRRMYDGRHMVVFVERSLIDVAAFATTWIKPELRNAELYVEWVSERYIPKCLELQSMYDSVVYLPVGVFSHVDDGVRAKATTQNEVAASILDYARSTPPELIELRETTIEGRSREVLGLFRERLFPDGKVIIK